MNRASLILLAGGLSLTALACGSDSAQRPRAASVPGTLTGPEPASVNAAPRANNPDLRSPTAGSIHIDDRIVKACGDLPVAHFAFDSAAINGDAASALGAVARCFDSGPLKGKSMKLVGHADPRGEAGYNLALGQDRATSVASFLENRGVGADRVSTMSKGEMDATGTDEAGWARDRKVEIFLRD